MKELKLKPLNLLVILACILYSCSNTEKVKYISECADQLVKSGEIEKSRAEDYCSCLYDVLSKENPNVLMSDSTWSLESEKSVTIYMTPCNEFLK